MHWQGQDVPAGSKNQKRESKNGEFIGDSSHHHYHVCDQPHYKDGNKAGSRIDFYKKEKAQSKKDLEIEAAIAKKGAEMVSNALRLRFGLMVFGVRGRVGMEENATKCQCEVRLPGPSRAACPRP